MPILCHFENAYFSLNPIDSDLTKKGTNTCRVYGTVTIKNYLLPQSPLLLLLQYYSEIDESIHGNLYIIQVMSGNNVTSQLLSLE